MSKLTVGYAFFNCSASLSSALADLSASSFSLIVGSGDEFKLKLVSMAFELRRSLSFINISLEDTPSMARMGFKV